MTHFTFTVTGTCTCNRCAVVFVSDETPHDARSRSIPATNEERDKYVSDCRCMSHNDDVMSAGHCPKGDSPRTFPPPASDIFTFYHTNQHAVLDGNILRIFRAGSNWWLVCSVSFTDLLAQILTAWSHAGTRRSYLALYKYQMSQTDARDALLRADRAVDAQINRVFARRPSQVSST